MSLDDALTLAGQVLADYNAADGQDEPGAHQAGRLAQALRDLAATAVAWSAAAGPGTSAAALGTGARQIQDGIVRLEAEVARVDRATAELAGQRTTGQKAARPGSGRIRKVMSRIAGTEPGQERGPGLVVLSQAEAITAGQAAADAIAWHSRFDDCASCVAAGACGDRVRHQVTMTEYAALRRLLEGEYR